MPLRSRLDDREPEAGAGAIVRAPEASERELRFFGAQARPLVCDREQCEPVLRPGLDGDLTAAVAAGVLDHVRERTLERASIAAYTRRSGDHLEIATFGR